MISLLKGWEGAVEINGSFYNSINDVNVADIDFDSIHIKLFPKQKIQREPQTLTDQPEYRVKVKRYMTKPATETFDFMKKWNNDVPMPTTEMEGTKREETRGMVFMDLHRDIPGGYPLKWSGWIIKSAIIEEELI